MTVRHVPSWRPTRSASVPALLGVLVLGACTATTESSAPVVVSASLSTPSPFARSLSLQLDRPAAVAVDYWAADGPRLRVESPVGSTHVVQLTRLRAGRTYQYSVVGTATMGTFGTDTLPADLRKVVGAATGTRTTPLLLLHLYDPAGFMGYALLDQSNEIVWYYRSMDFPYGMTRRVNGNFVVMDKQRGLVELSPSGVVVSTLAQDRSHEMHHDVVATPANTLLFIAFDDRTVNGAVVRGDAIWEWNPEAGTSVRRWTAWDHFSAANAPALPAAGEWLHANALAMGPRGNVLMSVHHWNQILSISSDWQRVEWRLGGTGATAPVSGADVFSGQHSARELAGSRVLVFDNGIDRGRDSRAVEYALDASSAHVTWEFQPQPANYAAIIGSARRLANGNTVIAFGTSAGIVGSSGPAEVYEVSSAGARVWHLLVNTQLMFRAEPFDALGAEEVVPGPPGQP